MQVCHVLPIRASGKEKCTRIFVLHCCTNYGVPTGALDTKSARLLMEKLQEINLRRGRTILMVTHDPNAASFCSRILFIQDGVIFHELRRKIPNETQEDFYARILQVMAQMGGGSANVL